MPTYVVPQVLVFQEIDLVPAATLQPLPAHIAGGHAQLIRYSEADERAFGSLGQYDRLNDTEYAWPQRPAGGVVDQAYTKVTIKDALLRYFSDTIGSGDNIVTVAGEPNQIRADATNFKANGSAYPLDDALINRDVKIGDTAKIRAVVGSETYDLCTYVAGFKADPVAAVVGTCVEDTDNQDASSNTNNGGVKIGGVNNCVDIDTVDSTAYDGLEDGDVSETYTITVIESSTGENATTARLRVTSASGNDDVASVQPAAFGAPTDIGTRGLTVTFNNTNGTVCSESAEDGGYDHNDFVVGQQWRVTCSQAYVVTSGTSGGDYDGATDDTYIVEVSRGGTYSTNESLAPLIIVRTTKGKDVSGPTPITAASTAFEIGTHGVTISFDQAALVKGDRFYIEVQAEGDGPYRTLILGHNLPEDVIDNGETEVDLHLYIRKDVEVNPNRVEAAPQTNYEQSDTEITIKAGITAFDDSWTDVNGDPEALPVYTECGYSNLYLTVRYWLSELCREVNSIFNVSELADAISGPLHPDNPLKWGVFKALQNSNGRAVGYTSICDPDDPDSWAEMLEVIDGRRDTYGLVPLTRNKLVWSLYQAHVSGQSSPEFGRWRKAFFNTEGIPEKSIVTAETSEDGEEVLAILVDDPLTSGTQYTYLRVPGGNGNFVQNEVAPGDIVRFIFNTDGFGGETYEEFVVDSVINEDTIRLLTGHTAAVNVPEKMEIWRNLTATEQAQELALTWGFNDRRIHMIWPDQIESDGYNTEGYHLCAAIAGLISGVVPHQGLTRLEIAGFTNADRTTQVFNRTQLNTMAAGGVWIVTQDLEDGTIFSRHAVTTGDTEDLAQREEMLTRNLDSISFYFLDLYDPYIGVSNVTPSAISILRAETRGAIKFLESANFVPRLGPQLIEGDIVELRPHATLKDRVVVVLDLTLPFPMNNIEVHLRLVA